MKGKESASASGIVTTLLNYVPALIILLRYLLPYVNAYNADNLTGTLLQMSARGKGTLVKNGRECLIGVMLLGHYLRKLLESAACKNPSKGATVGGNRFTSGLFHALTCLIITTVSVRKEKKENKIK